MLNNQLPFFSIDHVIYIVLEKKFFMFGLTMLEFAYLFPPIVVIMVWIFYWQWIWYFDPREPCISMSAQINIENRFLRSIFQNNYAFSVGEHAYGCFQYSGIILDWTCISVFSL